MNDLDEQVTSLKQLLDQVHKPSAYHIETIKLKDEQIRQYKHKITQLSNEIRDHENKIQWLTSDIEKLLKNREDIEKMKQQLSALYPNQFYKSNHSLNLAGPNHQKQIPVIAKIPKSTIISKPQLKKTTR